jgi:hypothetical protein
MFDPNVDRVMAALAPHHAVLDIEGWARPFNQVAVDVDRSARRVAYQVGRVGRWARRRLTSRLRG